MFDYSANVVFDESADEKAVEIFIIFETSLETTSAIIFLNPFLTP